MKYVHSVDILQNLVQQPENGEVIQDAGDIRETTTMVMYSDYQAVPKLRTKPTNQPLSPRRIQAAGEASAVVRRRLRHC